MTNKYNTHTGCTGCLTADDGLCYLDISDVTKCPCLECLVKAMCRVPCDPYNKFREEDKLGRSYDDI